MQRFLYTLLFLIYSNSLFALSIPHETDKPPFYKYRIFHIDVARHFFTVDEIKVLLNKMSELKFNVLHFHLTDDQGWRIPIKGYDKFISVGSKRIEPNGSTVQNSFTVDELRELVRYAKTKGIDIMPEVDFPAHFRAGIAAYPELSCHDSPQIVGNRIYNPEAISAICVSNPKSYEVATAVIDTLCDIFPFEMIHLGGDECDFSHWEKCPKCQKMKKDNNLDETHELQALFMNKLAKYTHEKGRRMVAWDEQIDFKTPSFEPKPIIMVWRGSNMLPKVLEKGHQVIMSPSDFSYLDYCQGVPSSEPLGDHYRTFSQVYQFPTTIDSRIIGAGGCLWTEEITNAKEMQYMLFPRLFALSEVFYHGPNRLPYEEFAKRINPLLIRYANEGLTVSYTANLPIPYPTKLGFDIKSELPLIAPVFIKNLDGKRFKTLSHMLPVAKNQYTIFIDSENISKELFFNAYKHKGIYSLVAEKSAVPADEYPGQAGVASLVDGLYLQQERINGRLHAGHYRHPFYLGFRHVDSPYLDFVFELSEKQMIKKMTIPTLHNERSWITKPAKIELIFDNTVIPFDTKDDIKKPYTSEFVLKKELQLKSFTIRITPSLLPKSHYGEGQKGWVFLQEIFIE